LNKKKLNIKKKTIFNIFLFLRIKEYNALAFHYSLLQWNAKGF